VEPCSTLSRGPPLSHATTGRAAAIASSGTIPKCSPCGGPEGGADGGGA